MDAPAPPPPPPPPVEKTKEMSNSIREKQKPLLGLFQPGTPFGPQGQAYKGTGTEKKMNLPICGCFLNPCIISLYNISKLSCSYTLCANFYSQEELLKVIIPQSLQSANTVLVSSSHTVMSTGDFM